MQFVKAVFVNSTYKKPKKYEFATEERLLKGDLVVVDAAGLYQVARVVENSYFYPDGSPTKFVVSKLEGDLDVADQSKKYLEKIQKGIRFIEKARAIIDKDFQVISYKEGKYRKCGKTTLLLELANKWGASVVVESSRLAEFINSEYNTHKFVGADYLIRTDQKFIDELRYYVDDISTERFPILKKSLRGNTSLLGGFITESEDVVHID